jgi:hypothetical protein
MHGRVATLVVVCLALVGYAVAQSNSQNPSPEATSQTTTQPSTSSGDQPAAPKSDSALNPKSDTTAKPAASAAGGAQATPVSGLKIPSGSKIYIAPMGGFESYVVAGIMKKKVPVSIVTDRDKADFEIKGAAESEKAGWAKIVFLRNDSTNEQASINVTEIKSGNVVFAYSVHKGSSARGKQSAGEAIGKHLNEAIGKN